MKLFVSINTFIKRLIESWKTKPDFIINTTNIESAPTQQISKKFSFINAFISGTLGVQTLLSVLVGIAGITSIVIYDTFFNLESPMFISSSGNYNSIMDNKELLPELSYLLLPPIAPDVIPVNTDAYIEPVPESNYITPTDTAPEPDYIVTAEISPETGNRDIIVLFVLMGISCISISKIKQKRWV